MELVTLPDGRRTLAYTHPTPVPVITTAPGAAGPGVRPVPAWARTTALLAPTVGGGIAAAGIGISYAAPGLTAMTNALWAAAALIATGTAGAIALRTGRPRATGRGTTHITQQITATGLFGRATGTINHR
ncbi:hypothetical protein I3J05_07715 [Streptomyces clavuligerus]|uniref:hypothetical protein n=1 Tax=Streptomyces clavuligerus TaxID=1901 RepID=UPI0018CB6143|nr:hypothetical protein [Streptomyces clavuligerus]QPL68781.1 hypothetical protein I3J05_07715 [Streptomyces clavuligerus]